MVSPLPPPCLVYMSLILLLFFFKFSKYSACLTSFVMCGFKQCGFTCVATAILKEAWISSSNTTNDCLYCTDQLCGLSLLTCAGANQQRLNVKSNINIPKAQYCNATTVDWTSYKF